jgi:hypothetical protein
MQWLIKDMMVTDRVSWVIPASAAASGESPLGPALIPESASSPNVAKSRVPAPAPKKDAVYQPVSVKADTSSAPQAPTVKHAKPQEGGIVLTKVSDSAPVDSASPSAEQKNGNDKTLELVYSGSSVDKEGVSFQTDGPPVHKASEVSPTIISEVPVSGSSAPSTRATVGVWEIDLNGKTHLLNQTELSEGVSERVPLSWELYTMNFLNLPKVSYKGVEKIRARWCDTVELSGPSDSNSYSRALVWLDTEFGAPLEAELYNSNNALVKTVRAVSIQRVKLGDSTEWILKQWDVLDELSHQRVTIDVSAVSMNRNWSSDLYDEKSAKSAWPLIPDADWKDIE